VPVGREIPLPGAIDDQRRFAAEAGPDDVLIDDPSPRVDLMPQPSQWGAPSRQYRKKAFFWTDSGNSIRSMQPRVL
jgi:hypothetical protein